MGVLRVYNVALSEMLSVLRVLPLQSLAALVGTKSGSKRILAAADVNSRCVVVKLGKEVMGRGVAVCEVGEIVEKGLSVMGLRMEDVVLLPAAIALAELEEREEAEEGER
ncbi:uncharacterized protein MONOS_14349 [Monocercomonoides exilis]|uniref:uncharacterized protein n=1 Tax=Monocercomonoides exilis TaxID=2049356 RepID=UPI00355A7C0A|nr:hypothetical protein MONOS_14349 [Monocercomonoides exilis]|eukprot:MONOS_14349.1-p1 / transcript=MONOS_14349.1 / gene=MONOS_14349 / organism=Monocercomonoides_exilis_PA203 / gene_product=unspecified product / transcript_product=unspecified product / location=Mono_scaffold00986:6360-6747(-) / protein_length=110 / sequence_SO=supercontig / SO=protein_coding / is_pseudo=false